MSTMVVTVCDVMPVVTARTRQIRRGSDDGAVNREREADRWDGQERQEDEGEAETGGHVVAGEGQRAGGGVLAGGTEQPHGHGERHDRDRGPDAGPRAGAERAIPE